MGKIIEFCKEGQVCACSHTEKCSPTAQEESLVACSFNRTERHLCVMPIYVLPQPGQVTPYTTLLQGKGGSLSLLEQNMKVFSVINSDKFNRLRKKSLYFIHT